MNTQVKNCAPCYSYDALLLHHR